jgi:putative tryptophan/tyrosine transport system substrate-binding protein
MDRRGLITMMAGGILATPLAGKAQPTGKVYRIGYLTVPSRETAQGVANTFQLALTDLGWIEGKRGRDPDNPYRHVSNCRPGGLWPRC